MFDKVYLIKSISAVTNYNSSSCFFMIHGLNISQGSHHKKNPISDGCMVGLGNLIWTIGCEETIKCEGAIRREGAIRLEGMFKPEGPIRREGIIGSEGMIRSEGTVGC